MRFRATTVDSLLVVMKGPSGIVRTTRTVRGQFEIHEVDAGEYDLVVGEYPLPAAILPITVRSEPLVLETPIEIRPTLIPVTYPNLFRCHAGIVIRIPSPQGSWELMYRAYEFNGQMIASLGSQIGASTGMTIELSWGCWGGGGGAYDFGTGAYWITIDGEVLPEPGPVHWVGLVFSE